jgi:PST family polysaccharide transporter
VGYATIDWLMRSQGRADRAFGWAVISTTTYLACFVVGLPWGAVGVATGLGAANVVLFLPGFIYAASGTLIRLIDVLRAMLPSFALTIVTVGASYVLRTFIAQDWHPIVRLLATGCVIAAIMMCGAALVYGRLLLPRGMPTSDER